MQPRGLYLLFFTELWERFGFYILQTIILLYMTKHLMLPDAQAYLLYGTFSSMLYLTPVVGGYLADRYLGFQKSIIVGGVLFIIGYALTALPDLFFLGLSVIIVANGLFKPSVSSIVGDLYRPGDTRRDGGFTIFYMGVNIGSLLPPIFIGTLVRHMGWHVGFLLAAFGMAIGLLTFIFGKRRLRSAGRMPLLSPLHEKRGALRFYPLFYLGIILCTGLMWVLFKFPSETDLFLAIATIAILFIVVYLVLKEKKQQRNRMIACLVLIVISVGFWALYNQTYTSLMLYADRNVDKQILGFTIDTEFTQFFNPFFIILLSPILSHLWTALAKRKSNPSVPLKFSYGVLCMALGFFVLGIGGKWFGQNGEVSTWWLVSSYFFQTIGELLLYPIGLAMITTLSPKHLVGMMMGVWFLTQAAAFAIGGGLATLSSVPKDASAVSSLAIYDHSFFLYGGIATVLAILSFLLVPHIRRLIHTPDRISTVK